MITSLIKGNPAPVTWGDSHMPSRPVDRDKAEQELSASVKKAVTADEIAPKSKHVRKCIVYTWDYHTSLSIWNSLRVLPILSDEIMTFKALILVHKVIQEGHKCAIKEGQNQIGWLETCSRTMGSEGQRGYSSLIRAYVNFILAKLRFHKHHKEFNGVFEYEEYISLKGIDDPNEGFETINDLMDLQDKIDSFQKLVFAHFKDSGNNEARISALVPLVKESYGIYRFITSMARAIHRKTGAVEALEPVRQRYNAQHYNLRKFYYECSNLKFLTTLITVPKLPRDPPDLQKADEPSLPTRPKTTEPPREATRTPVPKSESPQPDDMAEQIRMLKHYEDQQAALKAKQDAEARRRADEAARQQREFEEQQRLQAQRERQAQDDLIQQQYASHQAGRTAELEREILAMRGQYERDQMMLEQYDRRVKTLEMEMQAVTQNIAQQMQAKDEMLKGLQDQGNLWRSKYEALAKLYSQLRNEHLDLLNKSKSLQLKANSAQEAIDKMERMERDMKSKNLELADMIRERDRARFEMDRLKSSHKDELERTKRDLRFAEERAQDATRSKGSEVSNMLSKYNRQLNELEDTLRNKQYEIDDLLKKLSESGGEADRVREEKDMEILIMKEGMDDTIRQMADLQMSQGDTETAVNAQIDTLILDQQKKFNAIIDSILQAGVQKIDDSIYELESPMQLGNQNATPEYTLATIEKAMTSATEFATVFDLYLSGERGGEHVEVIKTATSLAQAISDVLVNTKGITRLAKNDDAVDALVRIGKVPGDVVLRGLYSLQSYRLESMKLQGKKDLLLQNNMKSRDALAKLSSEIEVLIPKQTSATNRANGDIGDLVEQEMNAAARAIEAATEKLQLLMSRQKDTSRYSAVDLQVHDTILASALAITQAIARLIQAATDSQSEIVAQGRGSSSAQAFYKKNNRWTDGLISAAKAVAFATTVLIEAADGVISGSQSLEQLIVASNEVAAATAQLVQASRVKSELMSKTQDNLEKAAKAVTDACRALVRQVKAVSAKNLELADTDDYNSMGAHEFKMREMEQQVEILKLEKELTDARRKLGKMRKSAYHDSDL